MEKKGKGEENMNIGYQQRGNYQIPMIGMPKEEPMQIGRFGQMRKDYVKEHRKLIFYSMLTDCSLSEHLRNTDREAEEMLELLISQMAKNEGVSEELKAADMMSWVQKMNSIKARAMEVVKTELIFK